jgi:23S rRNA (cytidine1920-2'-O)/16S rRNA (cytidine1409-2'-O)-methyltransferase
MIRADLFLVEQGLATSRNRAQELIASGKVFLIVNGQRKAITKASAQIDPETASIEVVQEAGEAQYVSRGGLKMQGALQRTGFDVKGLKVLDIGISTGGFADCLLQRGAGAIVGLDVGHGQLAAQLQKDPRVRLFEGVNARDLSSEIIQKQLSESNAGRKFDLVVVDVSFISLTLVLPELIQYLEESSPVIALVKPQFEVGREGLGKNGVVKDPSRFGEVEAKIRRACSTLDLTVEDYFESSIEGTDGNREFFLYARHAQLAFSSFGSSPGFGPGSAGSGRL